jgi:hypothetical protein
VLEAACVLSYEQAAVAFPAQRKKKRRKHSGPRVRERKEISGAAGWTAVHLAQAEVSSAKQSVRFF